jgi:hypothetical protein
VWGALLGEILAARVVRLGMRGDRCAAGGRWGKLMMTDVVERRCRIRGITEFGVCMIIRQMDILALTIL